MQECTIRSYQWIRHGLDWRRSKGCKWILEVHGGCETWIRISFPDLIPGSQGDWIYAETTGMCGRRLGFQVRMCRLPIDLSDITLRITSFRYRMSSRCGLMLDILPPHRLFSLYLTRTPFLLVEASHTTSTTKVRTTRTHRSTLIAIGFRTSERFGRISGTRG
jgi:hypothetical protein